MTAEDLSMRVHTTEAVFRYQLGHGIVSHLVSTFFDLEQPFIMPSVNEQAFLVDMASEGASKAQVCSPQLVNAVCACAAVGLYLRIHD